MKAFNNAFISTTKPTKPDYRANGSTRPRRGRARRQPAEGIVEPGRRVERAERVQRTSEEERWKKMSLPGHMRAESQTDIVNGHLKRKDSSLSSLDGQQDQCLVQDKQREYDYSFRALGRKFLALPQAWRWLDNLGNDIHDHFAPGAYATAVTPVRGNGTSSTLRSLLIVLMMILIVFGALYSLVEYLLLATRVSACEVTSTVFLPVTYTVTKMMSSPSSSVMASPEHGNATLVTTIQSTSTATHTLTASATAEPQIDSTSTLPYVYTIDSAGNTDWINGVSPSSGVSLVTATTTVTVESSPITTADNTQVDPTDVTYLTGPTYTSTIYSFDTPDTTLTSTSTSTRYVTSTLEHASPASATTSGRSSFSGIASGGWNITAAITAGASPAALSSLEPESMTLTSVYFTPISSGKSTTTTTIHTTTTIALRYTTTVLPASSTSHGEDPMITSAALPATMSSSGSVLTDPLAQSSASTTPLISLSSSTDGSFPGEITETTRNSGFLSSSSASLPPEYSPLSRSSAVGISTAGLPSSLPPSWTWSMLPFHTNSTGGSAGTASPVSASMNPQPLSTIVPDAPSSDGTGSAGGRPGITQTLSPASSLSDRTTLYPQSIVSKGTSMVWGNSSVSRFSSMASPEAASTGSALSMPASIVSNSTRIANPESRSVATPQASSFSSGATGTVSSQSVITAASATTSSASDQPTRSSPNPDAGTAATNMPASGTPSPYSAATSYNSSLSLSTLTSATVSSPNPRPSATQLSSSSDSIASSRPSKTLSSRNSITLGASTNTVSKPVDTSSSLRLSKSSSSSTLTVQPKSSAGVNATSTDPFPASSATATPTGGCGEHGDFIIDFDDLPNFFPTENDTAITQAPPVLNPYHHLTFDDGYVYAPAPAEPYPPMSSPHLAVFLGNASRVTTRRRSEDEPKPGEIGDGPWESVSAFWFDAYSAWFGCDNPGPDTCTLVFKALSWSAATKKEELTFQQNSTIPPCQHRIEGCRLQKVDFPTSFRGLTGIQIQAFVRSKEKMFFMDDLALKWSNNTCAAGLLRQSSR